MGIIGNSNPSLNNNILTTVCNSGRNLTGSDASELCTLGLEVGNKDPLPENLPNIDTMNGAAEAVGNWITPTICPCAQKNCCNTNGKFSLMSWEIVAKVDELELFKVWFDWFVFFLQNGITNLKILFAALFPSLLFEGCHHPKNNAHLQSTRNQQ